MEKLNKMTITVYSTFNAGFINHNETRMLIWELRCYYLRKQVLKKNDVKIISDQDVTAEVHF